MQTKFSWRKNFFSNLYTIYSNGQLVGKLKDSTFSQTANGELNGKGYTFITKGFFVQHTDIIDPIDYKVIGKITYNTWMTKATISFYNKTINWKYDNLWNTKWSIFDSNGIKIQYSGSSTSGLIDSNIDDRLLLLSGLYVTNYYWQKSIVFYVVAFLPLWIVLIT